VLDSFAVPAYFQAESGGERVLELLNNAREDKVELVMSLINTGEVVYLTARNRGRKIAESLLKDLHNFPSPFMKPVKNGFSPRRGSRQPMPFRMLMHLPPHLTQELEGTLVTGDPEFGSVKDLQVLWLGE
jgi:hypothetical protein